MREKKGGERRYCCCHESGDSSEKKGGSEDGGSKGVEEKGGEEPLPASRNHCAMGVCDSPHLNDQNDSCSQTRTFLLHHEQDGSAA